MKENQVLNSNLELLKMIYYIIPFSFFIFILITFENFYAFLIIFSLFFFLYLYFSFKFKNTYFISILFLIGTLSLASYSFYMFSLYSDIGGYEKSFLKKEFVVVDYLSSNRYLVEDDFGGKFILKKANKNYKLGDVIKVYGMLYPTKLEYKSFEEFKRKKFFNLNLDFSNIKNIFQFDYNKYLQMKQIAGTIISRKEYLIGKKDLGIFSKIKESLIEKIKKIYSNYDDKYKALVLGLLIGDKSLLSKDIYKQFIHSGLVHIIVVSGGNIMFLIIFLSFILFFIPFYLRLFIIGVIIVFYTLIVGADSSVLRATIMGILSLLALFFGRLSDVRRLLAIAFMIMLIYNPYFLLYDLGFILSFLSILGILFFNRFLILDEKTNKIKSILIYFYNNYILPSIGAFIAVFPAILLFTKQVNLFAFLASIVVVPIVPILMLDNILVLVMSNLSIDMFSYIVKFNILLMDWIFYMAYIFGDKFTYFIKI